MNTLTRARIFRFISSITALIMIVLLVFTHPSLIATASDEPEQPAPSGTPSDGLDPTSTPPPTIWITPTPSPNPYITPTPTPILDITPTFTPTPTVTSTPSPLEPPDIEITPTSFDVTLREGAISTENLIIQNVGDSTLTFSITTSSTTSIPTYSLRFPTTKIEAGLIEQIQDSPDQNATFIVYLTTQADLSAAYQVQGRDARGDFVFHTLLDTAQQSQADLISYLEVQLVSAAVSSYRPFYIVNAISVTAGLEVLNDLAARPDVAYIEAEKIFHIPDPIPADDLSTDAVEWGVSKIRADQVWSEFDIYGEGAVVANIDTGVLHTHPALVNQYRGNMSGSHDYNWFDPRGASTPFDNNGHGTHTMGTMVGSDGGSNRIGVAPAAKWIAAKGCYSSSCTETDLLASAEWVLAPYPYGGSPSQGDPSMRPHVVNNSWGGWGGDLWYQASVNAWRAAGIFPAFSAGNSGPGSGTVGSPGDYAESFASGATDSSDVIASFSSRGPSSLTNETKPDVSSPGVSVRSAYNNGGYTSLSGTSMASPHTAGCVALILSAAPDLDLVSIENLLTSTAFDLGASGPDYTYGYGRIDCHAAVSEAREVGVPWLTVDPESGSVNPSDSQTVSLTFDTRNLDAGQYEAIATIHSNDPDEDPLDIPITLRVFAAEPDIEISPMSFDVRLPVGGSAESILNIANIGDATLNFELEVFTSDLAPDRQGGPDGFGYAFADSNQNGGPVFDWIDIRESGTRLSLTDDSYFFPIDLPFAFNFYGADYNQVAVASNGTIYFQDAYLGLGNAPIPSDHGYTPQAFIAVYWDDLNPSSHGEVYYQVLGSEPHRKLVVQYQEVAHYGYPSAHVTAQAILFEDSNSILVQYLDPSPRAGALATEGIQGDPSPATNWGLQYGFDSSVLTPNLAICYAYPDMPLDCSSGGTTPSWLSVDPREGAVEPGGSQNVFVSLDAAELIPGTYSGSITINSNDPDENPLTVPVTMHVTDEEPDIEIAPTSFEVNLPAGEVTQEDLSIANVGGATLTFELDVSTSDLAPDRQGGPDGFGYAFADSNQAGGPVFDWIDISDTGIPILLYDDSHYFPIDLSFNFNFYGVDYNQVAVASNGTIYFQDVYLGYNNTYIPSVVVFQPTNFIAVYWDDLNPYSHGDVYYQILGSEPQRKLIIQYQEIAHYGKTPDYVTAQAILFEGSNSILVQYLDPSSEAGSEATEGIQGDHDPELNWGLQYGYNERILTQNLAICYAYPDMPLDCSYSEPTRPWLSVDPTEGAVEPDASQTVVVSMDATHLIPGTYSGAITVNSNDPDENPLTIPVILNVTDEQPDIEIDPTSFDVNLTQGESTQENLSIGNVGGATLTFELDVSTSDLALDRQGGPDGFGYAFVDSDQSGGPVFNWIDISDSGTPLPLSDDSYYFPIDLPFQFNFYGIDYDEVAVGSNGTVYFQDAYLGLGNASIPSRNEYTPQVFIAVYWDDLNPSANGDIYYEIIGAEPHRRLIVQYQEVAHYGASSDTITAQVILFEGSNSILVQYLDPSNEVGISATEGIQGDPNPSTNWGLQYGFNSGVLSENLAICYAYPDMPLDCSEPSLSWLSVDPEAGAVEPEASQDVVVSLDAAHLIPGTYSGSITINSNDPDESQLTVPVTLNVTPGEPDIELTPTSFEVSLPAGGTTIENLSIANLGVSDLTFELEASIADPIPNPPGGPDGFGYTFMDSNDFGGPPFNWIDISTSGTRLSLADDTFAYPINLPFNFNFYGTDNSQVAVSANGAIYFQNVPLSYINYPIPTNSSSTPRSFIAVYWDDLNPITGSAVYYQILGSEPNRKFIVQWQQVPHYGSTSDVVTAQVILLESSNSILVQYLDPSSEAGSGATEGIQGDPSPDVNWGLQYGYNQAVLSENLTICYAYPDSYPNCVGPTAPWLSVDPASGNVRPEETQNIDVHIDASDLRVGEHLGAITVHSNDPDEGILVVPVTLHVIAPEPDIEVSPTSFDLTLPPGKSYLENLSISNVGDANLSFRVAVDKSPPVDWQPLSFPTNKVDPELRNIDLFAANSHTTFMVYLNRQANLASAFQFQDRGARGDFVFHTLQNTAQRTQAGLILYLEGQRTSGVVSSYRPFYIVNAISVTAGLEVLNDLAARPDVAYIEAERVFQIPDPIPGDDLSIDAVEWGVSKIRADEVWSEFNLRGEDIVVANIDTGVLHTHPALVNQYRGTSSGSHNYNWFDPRGASTPFDNNGHGTHTMGTMVGSDGGSNQIGVAPAAQWIAAKGCYSSSCTESDLLASAEWVLAPYPYGGSPSQGDPDMRPHVVNNSWGGYGGDLWYQASVNAWRAAGIFPAFSAGNSGPGSGTVGSPGDYAESFASGATDSSDVIAYFSSRGPSSLTNETKPDVSSPGVSVRSAYNNGGYTSLSGTSMASPHTAGCVALILSAAPDLDLISIESLLTSTAFDLGASGPDYTYGYGRIDCYAAVSEVASSWIRVTPTSGDVQPGSTQNLTVAFNTTGLSPGIYAASIEIESNDPDEALVRIVVTLTVTDYVD